HTNSKRDWSSDVCSSDLIRLEVSGAEPEALQSALVSEGATLGVDVAVQERGILQHAQRLIVMDVDSTLIQGEVIEMIADYAGCRSEERRVAQQRRERGNK